MTAAASPLQGAPPSSQRWFFGPVPDLLAGCGLVYLGFFAWQLLDGDSLRRWLPETLLPFLILVLGAPHYGATLLRVYENAADRRRYALFAVWITAALGVLFGAGLRWVAVGSFLVTLYFTWSPWHYAGQNYGLAVLFLRRRGVAVTGSAKRLLYGSFLLSYALVFLALHSSGATIGQVPASVEGTIYRFERLGIPISVRDVAGPLLVAGYLACVGGAAWRLRAARARDLLPSATLVGIQALWFLLPTAAATFRVGADLEPVRHRAYAFMWIAVGHFMQYLWITTYYAAASADTRGRARYLGKALLAGIALWTLPVIVFAPTWTGGPPYDLGLGLLAASVVNLHHFVLDGAIWKLRDGRVARMLLRPRSLAPPAPEAGGWRWRRTLGWAAGAAVLVIALEGQYEYWAGNLASRRGDLARVQRSIERLERIGQISPTVYVRLAQRDLQRGDVQGAIAELTHARRIYPTPEMWATLGAAHESAGRLHAALDAYDKALELDPDHVVALGRSARVLRRLGETEAALRRAERAAALAPRDVRLRLLISSLRDSPG